VALDRRGDDRSGGAPARRRSGNSQRGKKNGRRREGRRGEEMARVCVVLRWGFKREGEGAGGAVVVVVEDQVVTLLS
jgi:hypothetical protein